MPKICVFSFVSIQKQLKTWKTGYRVYQGVILSDGPKYKSDKILGLFPKQNDEFYKLEVLSED